MSALAKIFAISLNTFKEAVRNRVLYVLLFFAILILLGAWVASTLAIFGQEKIVRDLGVASINVISVLIAVFVGVGLVYNDLDKKTIYTIVSKPISRWHYLIGKYFGLLLTIYVNILIMTFFFLGVLYFRDYVSDERLLTSVGEDAGGSQVLLYYLASFFKSACRAIATIVTLGFYYSPVTAGVMGASIMTMLEMAIITAFAVMFSSFSSPILSAFLTLIVFIIGRANEDLIYFADLMARKVGGPENLEGGQWITYWFSWLASHVAPNLEVFNQRPEVANAIMPEISAFSILYGFGYAAVVLLIAAAIFSNRNFK